MKKPFLLFFLFLLLQSSVFALKITKVNYNIEGCGAKIFGVTQDYVLAQAVPVDTKTDFENEEAFKLYLENYTQRLNNLRAFEKIEVTYEIIDNDITLNVYVKDSFHLFAIPGPKYDSNTGLTFKLKIKDSNFLGSLNTLNSGIYFMIPTFESDADHAEFGFDINFDYPFKLGIFDATWLNDLDFSFTMGDKLPEWGISTGLRLGLPVGKHSIIFETNQKFNNNFDYKEFNDSMYFVNDFKISMPLKVAELEYSGDVLYTPYIKTSINWDFNGISKLNSDLSSPVLTAGHKIAFGRTDWNSNLRDGYYFSVDNYYTWNFQRQRFYPVIEMNAAAYKKIDLFDDSFILRNLGLCTDIRAFTFMSNPKKNKYIMNDGKAIGHYIRGVRDSQEFKDTQYSALTPTSALIFNFDIPIHLFSTNFQKSFLRYFNFDLQLSPFFDMALCYNKITQSIFSFKDGFYGTGLEVIVYPLKWSGITVRASVGIDAGRKFFAKNLNMDWRQNVSKTEIQLGFGLHY
ncbi:MAG: hypothetical protein J5726_05105 [Treponema sp.]|nr:hypothetical protein [Treponema sp.]